MSERQTVAGAYAKIDAHEDICAVRYKAIEDGLSDVKSEVKRHGAAAWVIAVALLGWLALQVWDLRDARPAGAAQVVVQQKNNP